METIEIKESMKILIVDDSETSILLHEIFIRKMLPDAEQFIAINGEAGLNIFKENQDISIVISDYEMPKMNGVEMLSEIQKINPNIISLCVSSKNMDKTDNTFDVCLVKPVSKETLRTNLVNLILK